MILIKIIRKFISIIDYRKYYKWFKTCFYTSKDLTTIINVFDNNFKSFPYTLDNSVTYFEDRPPIELYQPEINYDELFDHYVDRMKNKDGLVENAVQKFSAQKEFKEKILNLKNPEILKDYQGQKLEFNFITSTDEVASRLKYFRNNQFFQAAAIGVTQTNDGYILLGNRWLMDPINGKPLVDIVGHGLWATPPGGSVGWKDKYDIDPISDTQIEEVSQEIGNYQILSNKPIGIFEVSQDAKGPKGIKFLNHIRINADLKDVIDMNIEANCLFREYMRHGKNHKEAKKELEKSGFPEDAWEHRFMIGLEPREIKDFLEQHKESFCGVGYGALMLYTKWLERQSN